jgi:ABC-type dipeptide/oligopeptide/nickel transport system permease component
MFYMLILNVVGFLLGVTGARNKGEDRRFAILGLALNVMPIFVAMILVIGVRSTLEQKIGSLPW